MRAATPDGPKWAARGAMGGMGSWGGRWEELKIWKFQTALNGRPGSDGRDGGLGGLVEVLRIRKFETALNGRPGGLSRSDGGEYGGECKMISLQTP